MFIRGSILEPFYFFSLDVTIVPMGYLLHHAVDFIALVDDGCKKIIILFLRRHTISMGTVVLAIPRAPRIAGQEIRTCVYSTGFFTWAVHLAAPKPPRFCSTLLRNGCNRNFRGQQTAAKYRGSPRIRNRETCQNPNRQWGFIARSSASRLRRNVLRTAQTPPSRRRLSYKRQHRLDAKCFPSHSYPQPGLGYSALTRCKLRIDV